MTVADEGSTFDTETMAELHARQGRPADALAIYRRLTDAGDPAARERRLRRVAALETAIGGGGAGAEGGSTGVAANPGPVAPARELAAPPAVTVQIGPGAVTVDWVVLPDTPSPALQLVLIRRTAAGVQTEKRTLLVNAPSGRLTLPIEGDPAALAAIGTAAGDRFIALAHDRGL